MSDVLPVRIRAQNAAIIFRRADSSTSLECFEVSPCSHDVMRSKGSLRRTLPAHGLSIPMDVIDNQDFCQELCVKLSRLDSEIVDEMMPQSRKAGSQWTEFRDTCHPALVTEMLMTSLSAVSTPIDVLQVTKRIRDDVLWNDCRVPWRRSSLWLILRVSLQTTLVHSLKAEEAFINYKNFMIYFLAAILGLVWQHSPDVELLKIIQMKMARRAAKLGKNIFAFVQEKALAISEEVTRFSENTWVGLQGQDASRETKINVATVKDDIALTMSHCRPALNAALLEFRSDHNGRISIPLSSNEWITSSEDGFPVVQTTSVPGEKIYALAEFEQWIWQSLPCWLENALSHPDAKQCTTIAASAKDYIKIASEVYDSCSEQQSLMLLAIGELWRALDVIAGYLLPLLHKYPPGITTGHFHPLLLPKRAQMQRLQDLEIYINRRRNNAIFPGLKIFVDPSASEIDCFASKYYEQSSHHQNLRQEILADAADRRSEKEREWQHGTSRYDELNKEFVSIVKCETQVNQYGSEEHKMTCRKCELKRLMSQMTITVFEWPLPSNETLLRVVIFELSCPETFAAWRNLTWMFSHDMGRPRETLGKEPHDYLSTYHNLRNYYNSSTSRIVLAASTKSVIASHYGRSQYPVELEKVSCGHGLHWEFYDSGHSIWLHDHTEPLSFSHRCQTLLPEGPYKNLQYAVDYNGHSQNKVLASQSNCSPGLTLHEYIAYGSLRADSEKTQWLNICRELRAPNLTWNAEAVFVLVRQSAWQVGTASDSYLRAAHNLFGIPQFCEELLSNVSRLVTSIQANRKSVNTMKSLILILQRTLSLGGKECTSKTVSLLHRCRSIVFDWTAGLIEGLRTTSSAHRVALIQRNLLRVAFLCKMTFDVDPEYVSRMMTSSDDIHQWTACAIMVQDNLPGAESSLPTDLRLLLLRDRKISHSLHRCLQSLLIAPDNSGLDQSILKSWSSLQKSANTWQCLEGSQGCWMYKNTLSGLQSTQQTVHYNVLNGQLLVDGRPIGRLPREYTSNKFFIRTFGARMMRVSASDMPGMIYMTVHQEHGYRFHFSMRKDDLVIRAQNLETVLEIIPHHRFAGDFPTLLIQECEHWLDIRTSQVEFRPMTRKRTSDAKNWRLHYNPEGVSFIRNNDNYLLDMRGPTYQKASSVFGGLEKAEYLHVTLSLCGEVEVTLPRFGFHFFINDEADLECRELRKVVDANQGIGTLIGLKSRLVVRAQGDQSRNLDRIVLIPQGETSTTREGPHLSIYISSAKRSVSCLRYQHDPILGRLEGDGTVVSRLFQAYLHALSSYVLSDPLTGSLGTEESIRLLNEQSDRCCRPLEGAEIDLLNLIAALTPERVFYPKHLRYMQRVSWHGGLSSLSQSGTFISLAQRIFDHAKQYNVFYRDSEPLNILKARGDPHLLERAQIRHSVYQNVDYSGKACNNQGDIFYKSREGSRDAGRAVRAYEISSLVASWSSDMAIYSRDLVKDWTSSGTMSQFGLDFDFSATVTELLKLSFAGSWAPLYKYCRQATRAKSQHKLLFFFSNIAYGSNGFSLDDLKILLAFATNTALRNLPSFPNHKFFTLKNGSEADRNKVWSTISCYVKPWPGAGIYASATERAQQYKEYQKESELNIRDATNFYMSQWPSKVPSSIPSSCSKWLKVEDVNSSLQKLFAEWYKNQECEHHLRAIQNVLDTFTGTSKPSYNFQSFHGVRSLPRPNTNCPLPTLASLMTARSPMEPGSIPQFCIKQDVKALEANQEIRSLVLKGLGTTNSTSPKACTRTQYKDDLLASLDAFESHLETVLPTKIPFSLIQKTSTYFDQSKCFCHGVFKQLSDTLEPADSTSQLLKAAGLWPRLQKRDLLGVLASQSNITVSLDWKKRITTAGEAITLFQRARRLILAAERRDSLSFFQEIQNPGRAGWSARDWPDWLLMEIENDLLIRDMQAQVALEMITPSSSSNTLMQLNMVIAFSSACLRLQWLELTGHRAKANPPSSYP